MTLTEELLAPLAIEHAVALEPQRSVRAGVFGLGRSGLLHAATLSTIANVELVAIGDPDRNARRNARGMGLAARSFASAATLLQRATPEVLFVATALDLRAGLAAQALEAGVAVQIEGVPALTATDAAPLIHAAARAERSIACAWSLAYHPVFDLARRIVAAGTLGPVRQVRASRNVSRVVTPLHQRAYSAHGGPRGVLAHVGAEMMFVLVRMFGMPSSVAATFQSLYGALDDEARGGWTLERGARLGFETSWSAPGYPRPATVIEVEAEFGRMLLSEDAVEIDLAMARGAFPSGGTRFGRADLPQSARFEFDGGELWLQDATFLAAMTDGNVAPTELSACLDTLRVIDALYASAATGGGPVEVAR